MSVGSIPRRVSTALLTALGSGVVPRIGLEYTAVGRKKEIAALLEDLDNVAAGGAMFRVVIGRYGSGKSFMLQLLRNHAMNRGFAVADADLSPDRRLAGTAGQGLATYRELMRNLATKTRPDGGALEAILERWMSDVQALAMKDSGLRSGDAAFDRVVEEHILEVVGRMEGLVHGFDFAQVLSAYWKGYRQGDDARKDAALRWLRGEFTTKVEAHASLGVRSIIDDAGWYDYLKLMASFVTSIGYRGLLVFIDEAVNLYKISHTVSRQGNYEKLLAMLNDVVQGKAERLGILLGGTPQFLEDPRRGLYSYEALRSRLAESRFVKAGFQDLSGPIIRLESLSSDEVFVLLNRLTEIHRIHYGQATALTDADIQEFMQEIVNRLGADALLTPREVIRDFLSVLNVLRQNPDVVFGQMVHGSDFQPGAAGKDPDAAEFAEFTL